MRIRYKAEKIHEGDLTPMIDMTFQLIAFFMVLINFSQNDHNVEIELPQSALARPPEEQVAYPLTLQLNDENKVIVGGQTVPISGVRVYLVREKTLLENRDLSAADATIIIRAHRQAKMGVVQELMKVCQDAKFEKFALRAKQDVGY